MKAQLAVLLLAAVYVAVEAQYWEPYNYADSYYDVDDYQSDYASPYSFYEPEPVLRQGRGGKGGFWYYWGPGYGHKGGGHSLGGHGHGLHRGGHHGGFGGGGGGGGGWGGGWPKPTPVKHIYHQPPKFPYSPPPVIHAAGPIIKRHHPVYVKGWGGWK